MKINAQNFLSSLKNTSFQNVIFFISGNDVSFIASIERIITKKLKDIDVIVGIKTENKSGLEFEDFNCPTETLFNSGTLIIHKNFKKIDISKIKEVNLELKTIILSSESTKKLPKVKKYFDDHKTFYSIVCYELTKEYKKNLINGFLSSNNISVETSAYWYLLENTNDKYQLLINELEKIKTYADKEISLTEIKYLLSDQQNFDIDGLFFLILSSAQNIIIKTNKLIQNSGDAYAVLQRVKFFHSLTIPAYEAYKKTNRVSDAEIFLPKYLFIIREKFINLILKTNQKKIIEMQNLIKKSEILLRKNENMYLIIAQRLLLNLRKNFN